MKSIAPSPNPRVRLSGLAYFVRGAMGIPDYWHPVLAVRREGLHAASGPYPFSLAAKAEFPGDFTEEGIPFVVSGGRAIAAPVLALQYGLGSYERFLDTGEARYRAQFDNVVRWAEANVAPLGDGAGWPNDYDYAMYGLSAPWFSGMVQGLGLALLAKAVALYDLPRHRNLMDSICRGFRAPVERGGYARVFRGGLVYEEYPSRNLNFVFNGACHALLGLWEAERTGVAGSRAAFDEGLSVLRAGIGEFDLAGGWSLYSLDSQNGSPLVATYYYQRANAVLAGIMGEITADERFTRYGARWRAAAGNFPVRVSNTVRMCSQRVLSARIRRFIVRR